VSQSVVDKVIATESIEIGTVYSKVPFSVFKFKLLFILARAVAGS